MFTVLLQFLPSNLICKTYPAHSIVGSMNIRVSRYIVFSARCNATIVEIVATSGRGRHLWTSPWPSAHKPMLLKGRLDFFTRTSWLRRKTTVDLVQLLTLPTMETNTLHRSNRFPNPSPKSLRKSPVKPPQHQNQPSMLGSFRSGKNAY